MGRVDGASDRSSAMPSVITLALEQYGASLSPEGFIQRGGKTLPVSVAVHNCLLLDRWRGQPWKI